MRNLKKVLALVIAFSMMLSVVAFAGYNDVAPDADYAGAVELLSALEIFEGDDKGNFNPDNTITRAEAAAVVCRALGLENSAEGAKGVTAFTDVAADHWATGYINLATQNGIINGHGDGTFGPEDAVTYEQIVKMIVCALGFEPMAAQKGGYPTGYLVVANAYKVTAGVAASVEAPRKTVAQLLANALVTPKMDQTQYGVDAKWEILDGKNDRDYATLLTDMDIYIASGIVGEKDLEEDTVEFSVQEASADYEFGLKAYNEKKDGYAALYSGDYDLEIAINGTDIANYETQYVDVYVQKSSKGKYAALAVVPSEMGATFSLVAGDIKETNDNKVVYYVDGTTKTKTLKVADKVVYSLNKGLEESDDYDIKALPDLDDEIEIKFIENTGDSEYDMIIATKYEDTTVADVDVKNGRIQIGKSWLNVEEDAETVEFAFYDATGAELTIADFEEDDVVAYVANNNSLKKATYVRVIKLTDNAIEGVVTEKSKQNNKNYVWINGEKYETLEELKIEDEGIFYIGMTGKIFKFEGASVAGNYAYVLEAAKGQAMFSDDTWSVKLLTVANGVVEYTFTEDAEKAFTTDTYEVTIEGKKVKKTYLELLGITGDKWLYKGTNRDNAYRLITFKTNSKGEIKSFEYVAEGKIKAIKEDEYIAKSQKINGKVLEDDTVIFNLNTDDVDDVYATDISLLVDEVKYAGFVVEVDKEVELFVLTTGGEAKASDEVGFAIVTDVRQTNVDGEDFTVVSYIQDMNEGEITFGEDSEKYAKATESDLYDTLEIGDVFVFAADANGYVLNYAILATAGKNTFAVNKDVLDAFTEENEFVYGYILSDEDQSKKSAYEAFVVGGLEMKEGTDKTYSLYVYDYTNTYSFYETKRDIEINTEYIDGEADWYYDAGKDEYDDEATFFFARLVDGDLIDIYTHGTRVEGVDAIAAEAANAFYYNCDKLAVDEIKDGVVDKDLQDKVEAKAAEEKAAADKKAAKAVETLIKALAEDADAEAIASVQDAFDALTDDQKALVDEELAAKIDR